MLLLILFFLLLYFTTFPYLVLLLRCGCWGTKYRLCILLCVRVCKICNIGLRNSDSISTIICLLRIFIFYSCAGLHHYLYYLIFSFQRFHFFVSLQVAFCCAHRVGHSLQAEIRCLFKYLTLCSTVQDPASFVSYQHTSCYGCTRKLALPWLWLQHAAGTLFHLFSCTSTNVTYRT